MVTFASNLEVMTRVGDNKIIMLEGGMNIKKGYKPSTNQWL